MKISDDCDLCSQLPDLALKHGYHDMELHGEHNFRLYLGELDCVGCQSLYSKSQEEFGKPRSRTP